MTAMRVAAIDCGTNSIRLLVADVDPDAGTLRDVDRRMEVVRLGEGVDRTGRLAPQALERTWAACDRYAAVLRDLSAQRVRFVATSATRDAENRAEFVAGVRRRLAVEPEVITGDEEARLSFTGAVRGLAVPAWPALVFDIGGGSTEFVLGTQAPIAATSLDIGCVRLTERTMSTDPVTPSQIETARAGIDGALVAAAQVVPFEQAATLVGLAGTVTTVAALALALPTYDSTRIHGSVLTAEQVAAVTQQLLGETREQRAGHAVMHPGRADVIAAGSLILHRIVATVGLPRLLVSEHDILDGIAWSLAAVN